MSVENSCYHQTQRGKCTFPRCNHAFHSFPSWWKDEPSQPCSLGTLSWSECSLTTHPPLAPKLKVCWVTVVKRARVPQAILQGGPWGWFYSLSSFPLCWPCQRAILQGGWWMVCWDKSWNEERNRKCSGEDENDEGDKVTIYLPNFLNPIEARSYFKNQHSFCFLTHLSCSELSPEFFKVPKWREENRGCLTSGKRSTLITVWPSLWCNETCVSEYHHSKTGHVGPRVRFNVLAPLCLQLWRGHYNKILLLIDRRSVLSFLSQLGYSSWHRHRGSGFLPFVCSESLPPLIRRRKNSNKHFPSAKQMWFIINTALLRVHCTSETLTDWQVPDLRRFLSMFKHHRTGKHGKQRKGWIEEVEGLQK